MIHLHALPPVPPTSGTLATSIRRDLEVGRYDHVAQGAQWLRVMAEEAAGVAGVPAAAINLMRSTTQRTVAAVGADANLHARKDSMCDAIIEDGRTVHVADASVDERWATNPFVDGRWGSIRFYGAHPLVNPTGFVVGTLCVFDDRPRQLDTWQIAELDDLASRVVRALEDSRLVALEAGMRRATRTARTPAL